MLGRGEEAQISLETLVLLGAILVVAYIVVKGMRETTQKATKKMERASKDLFSEIDKIKKKG